MFLHYPLLFISVQTHREKTSSFHRLRELWFSTRYTFSVLSHSKLEGHFLLLDRIGRDIQEAFQQEKELQLSYKREPLLNELRELRVILQKKNLPARYFFSPILAMGHLIVPTYSRRRLPTGVMEAAFDTCFINRNWDGLDRVEDLTSRASFDDIKGTIYIQKVPIARYFATELSQFIATLERADEHSLIHLHCMPYEHPHEKIMLEMLTLAEECRERFQLPDYEEVHLHKLDEFFRYFLSLSEKKNIHEIQIMAAYLSEMMRARWGGFYRPMQDEEKEPMQASSKISVALELPFGSTVYPVQKLLKAYEAGRAFSFSLHFSVLEAHRRQAELQESLGEQLYGTEKLRRQAALRILCELSDLRVESILVRYLPLENEPELLMRILDRLYGGMTPISSSLLESLTHHQDDDVSARALLLLSRQKYEALPEFIEQFLLGGSHIALRPLARQILEKIGTKKAKKILRHLGPIPILRTSQSVIPKLDETKSLKITAEILENCANPVKREAALRIFSAYPDRAEIETFGTALADPEKALRLATIALLSNTDLAEVRQLIVTRLMFEEDPLLHRFLQEIISNMPKKIPLLS